MVRRIPAEGLAFIKQWEGLRLKAYQDEAGVWTIGYGHTSRAGGPIVTKGMTITEAEANEILLNDLAKFERRVSSLVKVPLNDFQYAALVAFDLNIGALDQSTLLKKLNARDYDAVPAELAKWVYTTDPRTKKKVKSRGLVNRRAAEAGLWVKGDFVSSSFVEAVPAKTAVQEALTKENIGWFFGLGIPFGSFFTATGPMGYALATISVLAFLGVGYVLFRRWQDSKATTKAVTAAD
ncbi:lysozyme [Brucella anthropi]|uniref:lysozyme n=1 Tax=Brucella anthropi TaxID=529 RepID=UPI000F6921A7|nr:lysozyme [Brucella anthropi]RRY03818.1 lysozyme [Brucella anthropi]